MMKTKISDYKAVQDFIGGLKEDKNVKLMKQFVQHGRISTFKHCERVAQLSYLLDKRLKLNADLPVLLTGAMLHDFYLYDWHDYSDGTHRLHGYIHASRALNNAMKYIHIDKPVQQVIYSHMWPLNITRIPRSKEAWIVCLADKMVSLKETFTERKKKN